MTNQELKETAVEIRKGIVTAVHSAASGHPGGSLSAADIFTYLYFEEMNIDPKDPKKEDRDRLVLSKGHVAPGLYATLAQTRIFSERGFKNAAPYRFLFTGTPGYEAYSGRGYVERLSRPGTFRSSRNGACRKNEKERLPCLCGDRRW